MLIDFILECTVPKEDLIESGPKKKETKDPWMLHMDNLSNSVGLKAGLILAIPKKVVAEYACGSNSRLSTMKPSIDPHHQAQNC